MKKKLIVLLILFISSKAISQQTISEKVAFHHYTFKCDFCSKIKKETKVDWYSIKSDDVSDKILTDGMVDGINKTLFGSEQKETICNGSRNGLHSYNQISHTIEYRLITAERGRVDKKQANADKVIHGIVGAKADYSSCGDNLYCGLKWALKEVLHWDNYENRYGFINDDGILVIPYIYKYPANFSENVCTVVNLSGEIGVIDIYGHTLLEFSSKYKKGYESENGIVKLITNEDEVYNFKTPYYKEIQFNKEKEIQKEKEKAAKREQEDEQKRIEGEKDEELLKIKKNESRIKELEGLIHQKYGDNNRNIEATGFKNNVLEIKINNANTWMQNNLNVTTFRNGEPILVARCKEEWELAGLRKEPACCYYGFNNVNKEKLGCLYNFYAVKDKRGLAPNGWHIPTTKDWNQLLESQKDKEFGDLFTSYKLRSVESLGKDQLKRMKNYWESKLLKQVKTTTNSSGFSNYFPKGINGYGDFMENSDFSLYWILNNDEIEDDYYSCFWLPNLDFEDLHTIQNNYTDLIKNKSFNDLTKLSQGFAQSERVNGYKIDGKGYSVRCVKGDNIPNELFTKANIKNKNYNETKTVKPILEQKSEVAKSNSEIINSKEDKEIVGDDNKESNIKYRKNIYNIFYSYNKKYWKIQDEVVNLTNSETNEFIAAYTSEQWSHYTDDERIKLIDNVRNEATKSPKAFLASKLARTAYYEYNYGNLDSCLELSKRALSIYDSNAFINAIISLCYLKGNSTFFLFSNETEEYFAKAQSIIKQQKDLNTSVTVSKYIIMELQSLNTKLSTSDKTDNSVLLIINSQIKQFESIKKNLEEQINQ